MRVERTVVRESNEQFERTLGGELNGQLVRVERTLGGQLSGQLVRVEQTVWGELGGLLVES